MPSKVEVEYQFPLPIVTEQQPTERSRQRKIGLLTRILCGKRDGDLRRDIEGIEANFKVDGSRTIMYFYDTKRDGSKTVEATPEDIKAVLDRRHARRKVA